jgi:hypothetical protein
MKVMFPTMNAQRFIHVMTLEVMGGFVACCLVMVSAEIVIAEFKAIAEGFGDAAEEKKQAEGKCDVTFHTGGSSNQCPS